MRKLTAFFALVISLTFFASTADACSRVLWHTNKGTVVGRTMDWFEPIGTNLWIFPRGIERNGLTGSNTLRWVSKYGSIIATGYDVTATDGMNEKGFAANGLWLAESDYGKRDEKIPGLALSLWIQYYLDNFKTVDEAVRFTRTTPFQLVTGVFATSGRTATAHLALADKSGDSAIIEYTNGKLVVYHSPKYTVMTNSPTFDKQLENLKRYQGFGGTLPLPGSTLAADRFVRATYYASHLPKPKNPREAIGGVWSVIRNVSAPFGTEDPAHPNISATQWVVAADLTSAIYFYGNTMSPAIFWVDLKKVNLEKGAPTLKLDVVHHGDSYIGDVTAKFVPSKPFQFQAP